MDTRSVPPTKKQAPPLQHAITLPPSLQSYCHRQLCEVVAAALDAVAPGHRDLAVSVGVKPVPAAQNKKHDFECWVPTRLYWRLRNQQQQQPRDVGEGDACARRPRKKQKREERKQQKKKQRKGEAAPQMPRVAVVSGFGLRREVDAVELAALLVSSIEEATGSDGRVLGAIRVAPGHAGVIHITSQPTLQLRSATGRVTCGSCGAVFGGATALWWHQMDAHGLRHADAKRNADVAAANSAAIIPFQQATWLRDTLAAAQASSAAATAKKGGSGGSDGAEKAAWITAAQRGDLEGLQRILRSDDGSGVREHLASATDRNGANALIWAAGGGHLAVCRWLCAARAEGGCGLDPCCRQRGRRGFAGRTPLHWAARNGRASVVRWFVLDKGVLPDVETDDGTTPLCLAAWQAQVEVLDILLAAGADPRRLNSYGCNAAMWACQSHADEARKLTLLQKLHALRPPVDFARVNSNGHGCLHKAAQRGNKALCRWLLKEALPSPPSSSSTSSSPSVSSSSSSPPSAFAAATAPDLEGVSVPDLARVEGHDALATWLTDALSAGVLHVHAAGAHVPFSRPGAGADARALDSRAASGTQIDNTHASSSPRRGDGGNAAGMAATTTTAAQEDGACEKDETRKHRPVVSVIIPVHNALPWLHQCLGSILLQCGSSGGSSSEGDKAIRPKDLQVCAHDDASTDGSSDALRSWAAKFTAAGVECILTHSTNSAPGFGPGAGEGASPSSSSSLSAADTVSATVQVQSTGAAVPEPRDESSKARPRGAGFGKNTAVAMSTGRYLCFIDADDVMRPDRIARQLALARTYEDGDEVDADEGGETNATTKATPFVLVGSGFVREPADATAHYTAWCNALTKEELWLQQYRELTVIQPTWFLLRAAFDRVGGYEVQAKDADAPIPSDLLFFHRHLDEGGVLDRVPEPLVTYRFLKSSVSWRISRRVLLRARLRALERRVLSSPRFAAGFTVWGAGRDGKNFVVELQPKYRSKIRALCDVDPAKIARGYDNPKHGIKLDIVHFSEAKPPLIICVAMGRTGGALETNVRSLGLVEGVDYWHFS